MAILSVWQTSPKVPTLEVQSVGTSGFQTPSLRNKGEVGSAKLHLVNVVVDVYCFASSVSPQSFDEFSLHCHAPKVSGEPVSETVG